MAHCGSSHVQYTAINIDHKDEFKPVLFVSEAYPKGEDDEPKTLDYMVQVREFERIDSATNWFYIPPYTRKREVHVQHILCNKIVMTKRNPGGQPDFSKRFGRQNRNNPLFANAYKLETESLRRIKDELQRRSKLEYEIVTTDEDDIQSEETSESDCSD